MKQSPPTTTPINYVAIGASAGGLEAIEAFFKYMPIDTGLAFIVIQHLSPDYKSLMPELLANRTEIPVFRAENNVEVEANSIYLITPRKNLTIFHGKLLLKEQERSGGLNLPIDIFFKSLAEDQGEKAIGVILSGTGSDGTRGSRAIKEVGGMVMVQSEDSAKFDSMPRSVIATGLADFILAPEEMPGQLQAYSKHPYANQPKRSSVLLSNDDGMTRIFALLRERSRIDFTFYKPSTVVRRIERRMMVNHIQDVPEYVRYLEEHAGEVSVLYQDLLIGVTSFMRDPQAFDIMEKKYIPELLARYNLREIRVWVAACSTGEEAYSLAILFRETMERMGKVVDVKIFATDVDHIAVERASLGTYPVGIVTDLPQQLLMKYFINREDGFQISRSIREMVVFAQHNLVKDPPFTNIDLISCRNVLIYLQPVLQRKVLELFNFSLNSHGVLFLGSSETTGEMGEFFESVEQKWKIYRSRGKRRPPHMNIETAAYNHTQIHRARSPGVALSAGNVTQDERLLERFIQAIAADYVDLAMLVNADMELIHAVGETARYLRVAPGLMTADISKLMPRELSIPIANGVQKVVKSGIGMVFSNIRMQLDGKQESLQMRIRPVAQKRGQDPLVAIFVELLNREGPSPNNAENHSFDVGAESQQRISDLESELQFTRENLQATVEELETSNEELQATNEELLASNEELQSTNEELQSVNEELYTVNAEYQSKITELTELNNDLDNLLDNTEIGILFLDEDLAIRRFSPRITRLFKIIDSDVGRSILDITNNLVDVQLKSLIRGVLANNKALEQEVLTDHGWYLMRVLPYRITSEIFAGVVMLFINIDKSKQGQLEITKNQKRAALALRAANMGVWEWDITTGILTWSDSNYQLFGLQAGKFTPTYNGFIERLYPDDRDMVIQAILKTVEQGEPFQVEHRVVWPDGSIHWLLAHAEAYSNAKGEATHMLGAAQDITKRKYVEMELQDARQMLQQVLNTIPMRIFWKDCNGHYIGCNNNFAQDVGVSTPEQVIGKLDRQFWPDRAELYLRDDQEVIASGKAKLGYEEQLTNASGHTIWIETTKVPLKYMDGTIYGILGTYRDITVDKRAHIALQSSKHLLRNLLEAIPLPVFYKNHAGIYLDCNAALLRFIGRDREAIVGKMVEEVWPLDVAATYRAMDEQLFAAADDAVQIYQSVMLHADGTRHQVEFHKAKFRSPDGTIGGLVAAMLDLSTLAKYHRI